jgi:hypothetical protein
MQVHLHVSLSFVPDYYKERRTQTWTRHYFWNPAINQSTTDLDRWRCESESLHSGAQRKVLPNVPNVTFLGEEDNKRVIFAKQIPDLPIKSGWNWIKRKMPNNYPSILLCLIFKKYVWNFPNIFKSFIKSIIDYNYFKAGTTCEQCAWTT